MKGTVKFFNSGKGYGFVSAEDGKDYFVHLSGILNNARLRDGDAVNFEIEDGDRGPKAVNVTLAEGGSSDDEEAPAQEEESAEEVDSNEE